MFAVKKNQKKLYAACSRRTHFPKQDEHITVDKDHGVVVERRTRVWAIPLHEKKSSFWDVFTTVIQTTRTIHRHKKRSHYEVAFHVTTATVTANQAACMIRSHWQIENSWHHLRDVGFYEDANQSTQQVARGLAHVRTWAINLARSQQTEPNKAQRERWRDLHTLIKWITGK